VGKMTEARKKEGPSKTTERECRQKSGIQGTVTQFSEKKAKKRGKRRKKNRKGGSHDWRFIRQWEEGRRESVWVETKKTGQKLRTLLPVRNCKTKGTGEEGNHKEFSGKLY